MGDDATQNANYLPFVIMQHWRTCGAPTVEIAPMLRGMARLAVPRRFPVPICDTSGGTGGVALIEGDLAALVCSGRKTRDIGRRHRGSST